MSLSDGSQFSEIGERLFFGAALLTIDVVVDVVVDVSAIAGAFAGAFAYRDSAAFRRFSLMSPRFISSSSALLLW
jgi:hypothetical protein